MTMKEVYNKWSDNLSVDSMDCDISELNSDLKKMLKKVSIKSFEKYVSKRRKIMKNLTHKIVKIHGYPGKHEVVKHHATGNQYIKIRPIGSSSNHPLKKVQLKDTGFTILGSVQ